MIKNPTIAGLAAGAVAATLYLSIATGSALGLLLFYLAPLPGFIVGFGWGIRAAIVAAISGTLLLAAGLGLSPSLAYMVTIAIPTVVFTHFAFLFRISEATTASSFPRPDNDNEGEPVIEWYPLGRLLLLVALYGGTLALAIILLLGSSHEDYLATISSQLDLVMSKAKEAGLLKKIKPEQFEHYKHLVQAVLPASMAILWSLLMVLNMWLAAHSVRLSELLQRDWPELSSFDIPPATSLVLIALVALSMILPGYGGLILSGYAGALAMVFLLLGLAIMHTVTRSYPGRSFVLSATYIAVIFIGWGAILMIVLGLAEPLFQLRQRSRAGPS